MEKEPRNTDSVQNETKTTKVADNPKAAGGVAKTRKVNESKLRNDKVKYKQIQDIMLKGQASNEAEALAVWKKGRSKRMWTHIWAHRGFYLMFLPVAVFVLILYYWPMLGIRYSFFDYKPVGDPVFVGFKHFQKMFSTKAFWTSFGNTLFLSIMKLLLTTATSVIISVFLNEMKNIYAKKTLQTLIYLPHFMSWAVVASIFSLILSPSATGMINGILKDLNIIDPNGSGIYFLADKAWWRPIFFLINIWKETGWGTVIVLATLSGINPESYALLPGFCDVTVQTDFRKYGMSPFLLCPRRLLLF